MRNHSYARILDRFLRWFVWPVLLVSLEAGHSQGQTQNRGDNDSASSKHSSGNTVYRAIRVIHPKVMSLSRVLRFKIGGEHRLVGRGVGTSDRWKYASGDSSPRPNTEARSLLEAKLTASIGKARLAIEEMQPFVPRRLNRREYAATIRDLLRIEWDCTDRFPLDDSLYGFDTVAEGLQLSTVLTESWMEVASEAIDRAYRVEEPPKLRAWNFCWESEFDQHRATRHLASTTAMPI